MILADSMSQLTQYMPDFICPESFSAVDKNLLYEGAQFFVVEFIPLFIRAA